MMMRELLSLLITLLVTTSALGAEQAGEQAPFQPDSAKKERISAAAVGWGNLIVPGLGATLRDKPSLGLLEASISIGSFYGGSLLTQEGRFKIDGSVDVPENGNVRDAVAARILQQVGLKYHFYNTFYHYQQTVIENEDTEREKSNPQPIYRGDWKDMLVAPFQWDNVSSIWSWPVILGVTGFLTYDYATHKLQRRHSHLSPFSDGLYAFSNIAAVPVGSSFGEDPLFRGFIQREMHGMTGSLALAVLSQSALFAFLHSDHVTSFIVGSYFGVEAYKLRGDLGPAMATHFWINVVIGVLDYWAFRRANGVGVPFNPPVAQITIPF